MKLNKKVLKNLIIESLEEMHGGEDTGTAYDDVRAGMESEPQPEDFAQNDIAAYFKQVGQEIQDRIKAFEEAPRHEMAPAMTPEDVKQALDEMDRVQQEIEDIKETLKNLKKQLHRNED